MGERPAIEPLLYEAEAAHRLGIRPRALQSERAAGRITYRRVAGRIMYRADDLIEWESAVQTLLQDSRRGEVHPEQKKAKSLARHSAFAENKDATGFIYFIAAGDDFVKIGFSRKPNVRLSFLQTGSPLPLRVLATTPGTPSGERSLHKRFAEYRTHREWFRIDGELRQFIEGLPRG